MLALCLLWLWAAWWIGAPSLFYAAGCAINLAATLWSFAYPATDLVAVNAAVLALFGTATLVLHFQLARSTGKRPAGPLPFHRFAAVASTVAVLLLTAGFVLGDIRLWLVATPKLAEWAAVAAALVLGLATLADPESRSAPPRLFALGLCAAAMGVSQLRLAPDRIAWGYAISLAAFVLVGSIIYSHRNRIVQFLSSLGMSAVDRAPSAGWFVWSAVSLCVVVICLAAQVDFVLHRTFDRLISSAAALVQLLGLVICARADDRQDLRRATILLAAAAAVVFAWAVVPVAAVTPVEVAVAAMLSLAAVLIVCGVPVARGDAIASPWTEAARSVLPAMVAFWCLTAVATIGSELAMYGGHGAVNVHGWAIAAVVVTLSAAAVISVLLALRRGTDLLGIPDQYRGWYVYAGELLLIATVCHMRLTMPWLFGGFLSQYWPLVVMAIAFAGVGVGELLRRRAPVLSEPLWNSGVLLPALPVLAYWAMPSRVELSNLLFVVGIFYAVLSVGRRSFTFGVVAALAGNAGLWSLLYKQPELRFMIHPQLWLIPAAVSVLAAAQLNRDRLDAGTLKFIRYGCLMLVYVSSTADIFLNGVRDHPWLPLVLAFLSVAGALTGTLFRLRAFLLLGTAFLGVSIVTMIYYATANLHWTWLWYVAGIALGAAIVAVFALFEKKRPQMLALVDGFRQWQ
jgi:hypothetical protein